MLKTVYFDLGNVLFFFSHHQMIEQVAKCCDLTPAQVKQLAFSQKLQESYEKGALTSEELYRYFKSVSPLSFSLCEFMDAISNIFTPNTALWPTVEQLKREEMRLILISNTCESHYNYVYSHYPILHLFDEKILSFELGVLKPDPRIFRKALSHRHGNPDQCFYTDDISTFVESARKEGLDSEVYINVPTLRSHLIARGCDFLA